MEVKELKDLKKKRKYIGIKLSKEEREKIEKFCQANDITISGLVRFSIEKVIDAKEEK